MTNRNKPINLETKFSLVEYDYHENIQEENIVNNVEKDHSIFFNLKTLLKSSYRLGVVSSSTFIIWLNVRMKILNSILEKVQKKKKDEMKNFQDETLLIAEKNLIEESKALTRINDMQNSAKAMLLESSEDLVYSCQIKCGVKTLEKAMYSLKYSSELMCFVNKKIKALHLESNIYTGKIKYLPDYEKKTISMIISYDLKNKGSLAWLEIFSVSVIKQLNKSLAATNGNITAFHEENATAKNELFTVLITHDFLEEEVRLDYLPSNLQSTKRIAHLDM